MLEGLGAAGVDAFSSLKRISGKVISLYFPVCHESNVALCETVPPEELSGPPSVGT